MMHGVNSTQTMQRELAKRLSAVGLQNDCSCGGAFGAEIAIVAEAPGERETRLKQPLIGASGQVLWDACRKMGVTRLNTYQTNVVKRQLVTVAAGRPDQRGKSPITKQELDAYKQVLLEELALLPNLRYIVAAGGFALEALTSEKGISVFRGSVLPLTLSGGRRVDVVCCNNPAAVIHDPKLDLIFRMDVNKLRKLRDGTFRPQEIRAIINPSFKEALDYIRECQAATTPVAYDIETMSNETACVGLALTAGEGMCINWRTQSSNTYSLREELTLRRALQDLFSSPTTKLVAQNGNFDNYWMWYKDRITVSQTWFDTMLAHHTLYPSLPHGLGFLVSTYTDNPYYKDEGHAWKGEGSVEDFWRYNVKDCCHLLPIAEKQLAELEQQGLRDFFFNHVMKLQPHLTRMTVGGVKCDATLKQRFTSELAAALEQALDKCQATARVATQHPDYLFNPRSWQQLGKLFFRDLKLVGRGSSTDAENRDRMLKHPRTSEDAKAAITAINSYLTDAKFYSTYANATIDPDGRFRCEYRQTGVQSAPGRLSSSGVMWGSGLNLQNIPPRGKPMFVADPGYEFSYFDMAQIEARIVAILANIKKWQEDFERARLQPGSYDAHRALAADMWSMDYDTVPREDTEPDPATGLDRYTRRYLAKRARHGLNYRMAADRLATTVRLPFREADDIYRRYHRVNPELRGWWQDTVDEVKRTKQLLSPLGRRWILLEQFSEDALDSIIAFRPQSTAGDWVASCIYRCERDPRWPRDARMVFNIHDALIAMNRPADGELVRSIMREHAETPIVIAPVVGEMASRKPVELIIPADFAVSQPDDQGIHRWSTLKKLKVAPEKHRTHAPISRF